MDKGSFCISLNWSYSVPSSNSLNHALVGNRRRLGYKLAFWNCRKGLIANLNQDTPKVIEIKRFVDKHQPHIFGIIETNLHSEHSRVYRRSPVHDGNPEKLKKKIQREACRSTEWVSDNRMVCAVTKTKLLVIATDQRRRSRFHDQKMKVTVCNAIIEDTKSEKLLGLIVNNNLTWKEYLYGESWRTEDNAKGLIPQLSQRAGILSKIVKTMPSHRFKQICSVLL